MAINKSKQLPLPIITAIYEILWEARDPATAFKQIEKILV